METLEAERTGLRERIRLLEASHADLNAAIVASYVRARRRCRGEITGGKVEDFVSRLGIGEIDHDVAAAFRNFMDIIIVHPTGYRKPYKVEAIARVSAMVSTSVWEISPFPQNRSPEEIVEAEGVSGLSLCRDNSALDLSGLPLSRQRGKVVSLGLWSAAA